MSVEETKHKMQAGKSYQCILILLGLCLTVFGILLGMFWESTFNRMLDKFLVLRPNTELYDMWATPTMKVTVNYYLFNWTNPEDFHDHTIKPKLEQLGPYSFTDVSNKFDIKWHPENASVSYRRKSSYYFDAENSGGSLNDKVVTMNSLAVIASVMTRGWTSMRRSVVNFLLRVYPQDLTLMKSARELLFDGFKDKLINVANAVPDSVTQLKLPFDKFGYCYPRNNSDFNGAFNMYTGADDIRKLGQLHTWKYENSTKAFPRQCSQIKNSLGEFQPTPLKKNQPIEYFVPELCRSLLLEYDQTVEFEGVPGFRYTGSLRSVDNGTLYPENICYCNGKCVPSGVMNISSCAYNAPFFMSYPHFYNADPYYLQQVEGLEPQQNIHELSIVLHPRTGFVLDLKARIQVNILVEPMGHLSMFRKTRRIFFPLMWMEQTIRITPDLITNLKVLHRFVVGGKIIGVFCVCIGLLLIVWSSVSHRLDRRKMSHSGSSDPEEERNRVGVCKMVKKYISFRRKSLERHNSGKPLLASAASTGCDSTSKSKGDSTPDTN